VESYCELRNEDVEEFFACRVYGWKEVCPEDIAERSPLTETESEDGVELEFRLAPPRTIARLASQFPHCNWTGWIEFEGTLDDWGPDTWQTMLSLSEVAESGLASEITGRESIKGRLKMDDDSIAVRWSVGERLGLKFVERAQPTGIATGQEAFLFFADPS
jgi:hypothetical protein